MEFKVSVIVPMYNAKRFIKAAVDGLLSQSLKELEVILVDDCSTDDSLQLCRNLYGENQRVQILSQPENMGPGEARNAGIKAARGEYIAFADSDDGVLKNAYEDLYKLAKEYSDADVIHSIGFILPLDKTDPDDIYSVDEKDYFPICCDAFDVSKEVKVLSDDLNERYEKWRKRAFHWQVGCKLYRTAFIRENQIDFGHIRLSEDMAFCFGVLFLAKTYVITPMRFYLYRISNESISRRGYTTKFFRTALHALCNVCPLVQRTMDKVQYFRDNPASRKGVFELVIRVLETEFVIPAYQSLGEEKILRDGMFDELMKEQFGDNAEYVTYCFLEQHRKYPPMESSNSQLNVETMLRYKEMQEKAKREGKD